MKKKALALFLGVVLLVTGCGGQESDSTPQATDKAQGTENTQNSTSQVTGMQEPAVFDGTIETGNEDMFTKRDYKVEYDAAEATLVQLEGNTATCGASAVKIEGSTITLQDEGTYVFRGSLDDGMILVDAENTDKVQVVLDNASIHSKTSAPLYVLQADKVFVTLAEGTTNTLSNGGSFQAIDENNIDAVIFSKDDLTLNGLGSLQLVSPAGHGIISKDDLVITSGAYTIDCASHGLDANDSVRLINAAFSIHSGKDGIHAENKDDAALGYVYIESGTYQIDAAGDGISAGATMQIENGSFDITAGGGSANSTKEHAEDMFGGGMGGHGGGKPGQGMKPEQGMPPEQGMEPGQDMSRIGMEPGGQEAATEDDSTSTKGLKATGNLTINNGSFTIDSADDAVHSNASVTVNGGTFEIATGDDAFHADENLDVEAGDINIAKSYEGLEGLYVAVNGGNIKLVAGDDGVNAAGGTDQSGMGGPRGRDKFGGGFGGGFGSTGNGSVQINGGSLYINASGDGIDANGILEITGGDTIVCGPTQGDTAVLDYDSTATITGGSFIGTGATQMAQTFSDSAQGVIAINARGQKAGSQITLTDKEGNTVTSYEPALDFSLLILSNPDMVKGETYTVTIGEASGEFTAS